MYFRVLLDQIKVRKHYLVLICVKPKKKSLVEIQDCWKEQIKSFIRRPQFDSFSTNIGCGRNITTKVRMEIKNTIIPDQNYEFNFSHDLLDHHSYPWNDFSDSSGNLNGKRNSSELSRKLLNPLIRHDPNCSDEFDAYVIVILSQL